MAQQDVLDGGGAASGLEHELIAFTLWLQQQGLMPALSGGLAQGDVVRQYGADQNRSLT